MGKYAEYGRELHTLPHRDNLNTNDSLLFYQGGEYKQLELNKIRASQAGVELNVTAPEGSVISVSNGTETFSKTGGTVQFSLAGVGTYTVSATKDGMSASETLVVDSIRVYNVTLEYYHIYGIQRDQNSSSPEWTRTDEAVGFEAVASIGNTTVGHSDFDDKYPWCDMKRYVMSTGDVMVWIPEFWYKREVDSNGIETIQICNIEITGFTKHPGSGVYVGAYKWSEGAKSISGVSVRDNISLNNYRSSVASTKGAGWCLHNIATWSAIQMLYLVEYANNNSQAALGYGILSTRMSTGTADNVAGLTGRPAGTDSQVDVIYRGIEGLWGNYAEWTDGLNIYEGAYYICTNPSNFASNTEVNYTMLSYSGATNILGNGIVYIMKTGYDPDNSWCMLPVAIGGSATTYFCDATYITNNWNSLLTGGSSTYGDRSGVYCAYMHHGPNYPDTGFTSRIAYYPSLDPNETTTVTGEWTYSN